MTNDLCGIPQELQIDILSSLDAISLIRCAMTCKSIYDTVQSSSLLMYTVQLHLDGLKDVGTTIGRPDLIESIVQRRQAWQSLETKEPITCRTQSNCFGFDLVGGAFASTDTEHLEVIWLPTASSVKGRTLQKPSTVIYPGAFAMDPTQDLIIFLDTDLHICSISANTIHPQAYQSPLQIHNEQYGSENTTCQIAHNIFVIHFSGVPEGERILIYDWTTSDLILDTSDIPFEPSLRGLRFDFGLLDPSYFFVTCPSSFGSIRLYRLGQSHKATSGPTHLATLHFPPTTSGTTIPKMTRFSGPIEANPLPGVPFTVHDDDRLHMITVEYRYKAVDGDWWGTCYFNLFLHQRLLLKYARRALKENSPLDVPWEEWGPSNTRFSDFTSERYGSRWIRYMHGQRVIFPRVNVGYNGYTREPSHSVDVFDFSLAAVLSAKGMLEIPSSSSTHNPGTFLPPSTIRTGDVPLFLNDVETHLPCVMSTLDFKRPHTNYMIYEDGIVGVNMLKNRSFILNIYAV